MGNQYILIPKKLQNSVLKDLHKDHMGTSHMKSINKLLFLVARSWQTDWRPSQIMLAVSSCEESTSCSSTSPLDLANKTLAEDPHSLCWSLHGKSFSSSGRCSFQMARSTRNGKYNNTKHYFSATWFVCKPWATRTNCIRQWPPVHLWGIQAAHKRKLSAPYHPPPIGGWVICVNLQASYEDGLTLSHRLANFTPHFMLPLMWHPLPQPTTPYSLLICSTWLRMLYLW